MGMMTIADTIEAFWCCTQIPPICEKCPEHGPIGELGRTCKFAVKESVYHWLKAQEPIRPNEIRHGDVLMYYQCPACTSALRAVDRYCSQCGRAVKWE